MLLFALLLGDCREGEEMQGGVGELQNEGALEPGGVMEPSGEDVEKRGVFPPPPAPDISPLGEPE